MNIKVIISILCVFLVMCILYIIFRMLNCSKKDDDSESYTYSGYNYTRQVCCHDNICDKEYVSKECILKKYNNTMYNPDGSPSGGILVTMFNLNNICVNYNYRGKTCLKSVDECGEDSFFNPGDINQILTMIKKTGGGTNCFALDTTYFRADMPQYVFGPYLGDMVIGLIIDTQVIFDYIACMFPIDAGSISRYNPSCVEDNFAAYIQSVKTKNKKDAWLEYIKSQNSRALGSSGCGVNDRGEKNGLIWAKNASDYFLWSEELAEDQYNVIEKLDEKDIDDTYWALSFFNKPFDKYQWRYWAESVKTIYDKAVKMGIEFIDNQFLGNDGYRENEVDIYVPNNPGVNCKDTCSMEDDNSNCTDLKCIYDKKKKSKNNSDKSKKILCDDCNVTEEFKHVFAKALLGVISVAEDNCSNTETMIKKGGPGQFGCVDNLECIYDSNSKSCGGKDISAEECIKNTSCCYDYKSKHCYKPTMTNSKCCCDVEFTDDVAKKMINTWNSSAYRVKYGGKKIGAYRMRVKDIYNFSYDKNSLKELDLKQII